MIEFVEGDILDTDCTILGHQVNCKGLMGAGLALQIRNKYPHVYTSYKSNVGSAPYAPDLLGTTQYVDSKDGKLIANMFSQYDIRHYHADDRNVYTNYKSFEKCCRNIRDLILSGETYDYNVDQLSVAFPYGIGCGLANGDWDTIYSIIENYFSDENITCKIYKKGE